MRKWGSLHGNLTSKVFSDMMVEKKGVAVCWRKWGRFLRPGWMGMMRT